MTDQELWESDPELWRAADKARKKWMWETEDEGDTAHQKAQIAFRAGFALGVAHQQSRDEEERP